MNPLRATTAKLAAMLSLAGLALAPAPALAGAGGTQAPGDAASVRAIGTRTVGTRVLQADSVVLLGRPVRFTGALGPAAANRTVAIERYDVRSASWISATTATTDGGGSFAAQWHTDQPGRFDVRLRVAGSSVRAMPADAPPSVQVTVYRPGYATWFGPGFYGRRTACNIVLTPRTVGVAHRTLPCNTKIQILYAGKTLTLPVVDRGPYGGRASWDLTQAAAQALGFDGNALIGAIRAPAAAR